MIDTSKITNWVIRADREFRGITQSFLLPDGTVAYTAGMTPDQYAADRGYPVRVITDTELDILTDIFEGDMITSPKRITHKRYWDYLECLPPCRFCHVRGVELFHVSERITCDLVTWCGKIGDKHFSWTDRATADLETLAAKVAAAAGVVPA